MRILTTVLASCALLATVAFRWAPPAEKSTAQIVVANSSGGSGEGSIATFPVDAKGNAAPTTFLSGQNTGLVQPSSVAIDSHGDVVTLYDEGSIGGHEIAIFPPGATGNTAPARVITDAEKKHRIYYVGVDESGHVYGFFEEGDSAFGIDVFPLSGNGKLSPTHTLKGPATELQQPLVPTQFFVGAMGDMWCVTDGQVGPALVLAWAPGAKNDDAPIAIFNIPANADPSFAVNTDDVLYLTLNVGSVRETEVFKSGGKPSATYTVDCGLTCTAAAANGTQVVFRTKAGYSPAALITYDLSGPSGLLHPVRTLKGTKTQLDSPLNAALR